jgi:flagellar protein FlbD
MIKLTRLNGDMIIVNPVQIMIIDSIPESKIVFMNKEYFIVSETPDEIIDKVAEFNRKSFEGHVMLTDRAVEKMEHQELHEVQG